MYKKMGFSAICLALFFLVVFSCFSGNKVNEIHISGSTTIAPFMKSVATQFKKKTDMEIKITAPGSISGIDSLIAGSCDIAMSSSDLLPRHLVFAEKNGVRIKSFLLGYDFIVPIVHPANGVSDISLTQLRAVYSGKIQNWSALGGKDAGIKIVNRNSSSGTSIIWHHTITPAGNSTGKTLDSNSSVLADIAADETAIGYISNGFVNSEVKLLRVDGIDLGNKETWTEHYPIKRSLFLYVDENKFTDTLKSFIIFILMDDEAKKAFHGKGFFSS